MTVRYWIAALYAGATMMAGAQTTPTDTERIAKLEEQVATLTGELEKDVFGDVIPELGDSKYGMGPAASKVYNQDQGLSIGGYGEGLYQNYDDSDKTDEADFLRAIIYLGYKFDEKWVLNTEIEFEHADEAYVEFAYLDYLYSDEINFRSGLLLVPVGIINELHEPTVFLSAKRPTVEQRIIPTTWRENGAGLFGDVGKVSYKLYVVNSLDGEDFTDQGLRGGRQKGSQAKADDFSVVGRLDLQVNTEVMVGGSAYYGDQGQDLDVDAETTLVEGHVVGEWGGLKVNALAVVAQVDGAGEFSRAIATRDLADGEVLPPDADLDAVGEEMVGWYVEVGYDLFAHRSKGEAALTPFVRYEELNTQDKMEDGFVANPKNDLDIVTFGLNYQPIDEVVFKVEHQFIEDGNDDSYDQTNLAMGYIF